MSRPLIEVKNGRMELRAGADYVDHPIMAVVVNGNLIIEKHLNGHQAYRCAVPLELLLRLDNNHAYRLEGLLTKVAVM